MSSRPYQPQHSRTRFTKSHKVGKCKVSNKRQYKDRLDVLLDHQLNPRTIRAYECQHCGMWHATSKPERRAA